MSSIKRKLSFRKSPSAYKYFDDYSNVTERQCRVLDKDNEYVFYRNIELYNKTNRLLQKKSAMFTISEPPVRPRTITNVEMWHIFKQRNSKTHNTFQTLAVLYLLNNKYKLIIDPGVEKLQEIHRNPFYFEPFQAIELAKRVSIENKEDFTKFNPEILCDKLSCQNGFLCSNPEHHSVGEKVDFLENTLNVGAGNEILNQQSQPLNDRAPTPTPTPTPSAPPASASASGNTTSFVATSLSCQQSQHQQSQHQQTHQVQTQAKQQQPQPLPMPIPSAPPVIPLPSSNPSISTSRESLIPSCSSTGNMELDSNPPAYYEPRSIEKENPSNSMNIPNSQSDKQISIIINK